MSSRCQVFQMTTAHASPARPRAPISRCRSSVARAEAWARRPLAPTCRVVRARRQLCRCPREARRASARARGADDRPGSRWARDLDDAARVRNANGKRSASACTFERAMCATVTMRWRPRSLRSSAVASAAERRCRTRRARRLRAGISQRNRRLQMRNESGREVLACPPKHGVGHRSFTGACVQGGHRAGSAFSASEPAPGVVHPRRTAPSPLRRLPFFDHDKPFVDSLQMELSLCANSPTRWGSAAIGLQTHSDLSMPNESPRGHRDPCTTP